MTDLLVAVWVFANLGVWHWILVGLIGGIALAIANLDYHGDTPSAVAGFVLGTFGWPLVYILIAIGVLLLGSCMLFDMLFRRKPPTRKIIAQ